MPLTPEEELELLQLEEEEYQSTLQTQPQVTQPTAPVPTTEASPSVTSSALTGAQQGVTLGLAPYIAGVAGGLGSLAGGGEFSSAYEEAKSERIAEQKLAEEANPNAYLVGGIAGGLAATPALAAGASATGARALSAAISKGTLPTLAAQGAVSGAATEEGAFVDKLKAGAVGGTLGAVGKLGGDELAKRGGAAIDALTPLYNKIKDKVGLKAAQNWLETQAGKYAESAAGLTRTLGQRADLEKKLAKGKIGEGEVGKKLLEEGIVTAKDTSKSIAQKAFDARSKAGDELGRIVSETPDIQPEQISMRLLQRAEGLEDIGANSELKQELTRLAETYMPKDVQKGVSAKTAQELKIDAGNKADWSAPSRDTQAMLNRDIDAALKETMSPEQLARYNSANETAAMLIPASEAASKQSAADLGKKAISLGAAPAIGLGYGAFQGDPVGGLAAGAAFRVAQKRGPQVAAGGMWTTAKLIERAPERLKGVLQSALTRGEKAFASTHYLLQQSDPEYQKATLEDGEGTE